MKKVDEIVRELDIAASVDAVWEALTSAEGLAGWFGDTAEIDLRPGGRGKIGWTEMGYTAEVAVEAVEPPAKFSFRWAALHDAPLEEASTLVEFALTGTEQGTHLRLVESGFAAIPDELYEKRYAENSGGWDSELGELVEHLTDAEKPVG